MLFKKNTVKPVEILTFLQEKLPTIRALFISKNGAAEGDYDNTLFTDQIIKEIKDACRQKNEQLTTTCGKPIILRPLPNKNDTICFTTAIGNSYTEELKQTVDLALDLFFKERVLKSKDKKQAIQKEQFKRTVQVLEQKHQEMLEEVERNNRTIREQQESYQRTLKAEIKAQTKEILKSQQEAEAANKAKSQFLASMSHEIRTPMNAVIGFADVLLGTKLDEEQLKSTEIIKKSGNALLSIINDILDFSKVEAGQMTLETVDFSPATIARDVSELVQPELASTPVEIRINIDESVPKYTIGDPGKYRQVLTNLVGNAIKFTSKGYIEISMKVESESDDSFSIITAVKDTGIGLTKESLESIFEMFQQADSSTTRKYGGTGLGLSICRRIANLMGGEVWAESVYGEGATFFFTALVGKSTGKADTLSAKVPQLQQKIGGEKKEQTKKCKLLIAEDHPVNQKLATIIFTKEGYDVTIAENGAIALETFTKSPDDFNAIFMDIQMPVMDGYEATKKIRAAGFTDIPIIAMTANVMDEDKAKCIEIGMNDFIAKPIQKKLVFETLNKWLMK